MSRIIFHVQNASGAPIDGALVRGINTPFGDWQGRSGQPPDAPGDFTADLAPGHYEIVTSLAGYVTRTVPADLSAPGTVTIALDRIDAATPAVIPSGGGRTDTGNSGTVTLAGEHVVVPTERLPTAFTKAQLADIQTNLMLFIGDAPQLQPHFDADGYDPTLRLRNRGDNGATPHGVASGQWLWTTTLPNYPEALWAVAFAQAKKFGATHWFLHVAALPIGGGYHGLYPVDESFAATYGDRLNRVHRAALEHGLIPICAGVSSVAPPAPGFDPQQVLVAMTAWDDFDTADCQIKAIATAFPKALLYYERPGPNARVSPKPDPCSQVQPDDSNGGAWLRSVQQRHPNFQGVFYEVNIWEAGGVRACADELTRCHPFWRDVQEVRGETNTYQLFWQGGSPPDYIALEDQLQAACPWLHGYASGGTPHPAPVEKPAAAAGALPAGDAFAFADAIQHRGTPFTTWPVTTEITRLEMRSTGVRVEFGKRDGAGRWPDVVPHGWEGPLQYCLGIAMKIGGVWHLSAPIQFWAGLDASGGNIGDPKPRDNGIPGTVHGDWFYATEWGPLQRQPAVGESVGFFVVAGNVRGIDDVVSVRERSNVVIVPFPDVNGAVFTRG